MTHVAAFHHDSETAVLGGGCFWCLEAAFSRVRGVHEVVSGYSGGISVNPSYDEVCGGHTGHAEVVRVTFDPAEISFDDILHIFFTIHDPTTLNRQGNDVGTQYRSVVFTTSEEQAKTVKKVIFEVAREHIYDEPIVTEIRPLEAFYPAEEHHQNYFAKNPEQAYCQIVIAPKIAKFRRKFGQFSK